MLKQLNLFTWARRHKSEHKHSLIYSMGRAIIRWMLFLSNSSALRVSPSVHTGNMYLPPWDHAASVLHEAGSSSMCREQSNENQRAVFPHSSANQTLTVYWCPITAVTNYHKLNDLNGEGNGNPCQYSCLENPMDRGAWWTRGPLLGSERIGHDWAHIHTHAMT